ncbi:MAG TPA: SRPBCC family protein [Thermoleophilaceae bacterium]
MRPVESRITISAPRDEVFQFIADMANRVAWMDHFLKDFRLTRVHTVGVGAGASFYIDAPVFPLRAEYQIVEAEAPRYLRERGRIGRWGRTTGWTEWELAESYGSTELTVTVWTEPGIRWDGIKESFGARPWLRRQVAASLRRLRKIFEEESDRPLARAGVAGYEPLKAARYGSGA